MAKEKKSFKASVQAVESPASAFISKPSENPVQENKEAVEGKQENKSVRINLLFRPSTKRNIEKLAFVNHTSTNDFINTVMDKYIADHADEIAKYDSFFSEGGK